MIWGLAERGVGGFLFLATTIYYEFYSVYCLLQYENLEFISLTLLKSRFTEQ
jgi:hypothetical protein